MNTYKNQDNYEANKMALRLKSNPIVQSYFNGIIESLEDNYDDLADILNIIEALECVKIAFKLEAKQNINRL